MKTAKYREKRERFGPDDINEYEENAVSELSSSPPEINRTRDRDRSFHDSYGNQGSYDLKRLSEDRPGMVDRISRYLKTHPKESALTVAKILEVAPSHLEEVAKCIGVNIIPDHDPRKI